MSPYEKAVAALNARLERLQATLSAATIETARQAAFQCIVVTLGLGEALNEYLTTVRDYAQRRHDELKETNDSLATRHAELLESGKQMLEQLKANPTDREIRRQIDVAQQNMAAIQKMVRRGTNALQRDVAPSVATIDPIADTVRRFVEATDRDDLGRVLRTLIGQVSELYATHPTITARDLIDTNAWEKTIESELDQASGPDDSYARAGYQALLAIGLMIFAVSENPPKAAAEAFSRGTEGVATRLKGITARFTEE
jgi:hypothetical protein